MGEVTLYRTTQAVGSYSRATCSLGADDPNRDGLGMAVTPKKVIWCKLGPLPLLTRPKKCFTAEKILPAPSGQKSRQLVLPAAPQP